MFHPDEPAMTSLSSPPASPTSARSKWETAACLAILLAVFAALTLPLLLQPHGGYDYDEKNFHIPAVMHIAAHWPRLDIAANSLSATAPGYHWFLAGLSLWLGTDIVTLRLVNCLVSAAVLVVLFLWLATRRPAVEALLLIAPLAASNYFVKGAAWVVTDNAALLMAMCGLLLLLTEKPNAVVAAAAGLFGGLATMSRQIYAWLALPMAAHAWIDRRWRPLRRPDLRWIAAAAVPLLCLAVLVASWGGLLPPRFHTAAVNEGVANASLAYMLSVAGLFAVFYLRVPATKDWVGIGAYALAAGFGLAAALATATNADHAAGRWGGALWEIAARMPSVGSRSVLFVLLAPIGAVMLLACYRAIRASGERHLADLWAISFIGWTVAMVPVKLVFQRYFEPMTLVFLIVAIGLMRGRPLERGQRLLLGALTAGQIALTFASAWDLTFRF